MDDLLLAFAYNVKTTHFQPSSNKVLQPKKRWDVLCRIIRECQESNFYNYLTLEKIQFAKRTHSNGIMENEHRRFYTYLQSQGCSMLKLRKMVNQNCYCMALRVGSILTFLQGIWCQRYKPQSLVPIPLPSADYEISTALKCHYTPRSGFIPYLCEYQVLRDARTA